ncbi:MAG: hypothetical protein ACK59B_17200, partial [Alphaproteobacteria bacterium]
PEHQVIDIHCRDMDALDTGGKAQACRADPAAEVAGELARPRGYGGCKHHGVQPGAEALARLEDLKAAAEKRVVGQVVCVQWTLIRG